MEYFQHIQNRTGQTVAVMNKYLPGMTVGTSTAGDFVTMSDALTTKAQLRDEAVDDFDQAVNAEHLGYLVIRGLGTSLPHMAEGDLDAEDETEAGLMDLFDSAYGIKPRTTEAAIERGQKVVSALTRVNTYLTAKTLKEVTSAGKGVADLSAALDAQPLLEQSLENMLASATLTRTDLRTASRQLDRLNKRAYAKLQTEARTNPDLKAGLGQVDTDSGGPPTLGIKKVMQGGADQRHVLVSYEDGSFTPGAVNTLEWMVVGVDLDFTSHSETADPSGNTLGAFTVGQTVKLRTRVVLAGTTTGSTRTITIAAL